jgi:hypothetical protein
MRFGNTLRPVAVDRKSYLFAFLNIITVNSVKTNSISGGYGVAVTVFLSPFTVD